MAMGVATGLICTLVNALTRPSTEPCLARFLREGGLPSPGDRGRTRAAFFSYNGGGWLDFEFPENGWSGRSSSSMGGNKLVVDPGDGGAGDEENLRGLGDDGSELRVSAAGEEAELIRSGRV
jgi:hypothetical protein